MRRKEAVMQRRAPRMTLDSAGQDGVARISVGDVAFCDRSRRKTTACMRVRLCMTFRISPNICDMDERDHSFCSPYSCLPACELVHRCKKMDKPTFDTQVILGIY